MNRVKNSVASVVSNMAAIRSSLSVFSNFLSQSTNIVACGLQQVRNTYTGKWMRRDVKRRKLAEEFAPMRLRLVAMKRNNILPAEIQEAAGKQIDETIPRYSGVRMLTKRCALTSRARGNVHRWRLSRFMFRHLADYNKLSGVQRAIF